MFCLTLKPKRTVLLLIGSETRGEMIVRTAMKSDSGWIAKVYSSVPHSWVILNPDGTVTGYNGGVTKWFPHEGWGKEQAE